MDSSRDHDNESKDVNRYEVDNEINYGRDGDAEVTRGNRRPQYMRAGRRPSSFNGMHRRRNKRVAW